MIRNILALIGIIAIIVGGFMFMKMGPMMKMMPMMTNPEMQPIMEVLQNNFDEASEAAGNLNEGAAETAAVLFQKWIDNKGEIGATTVWAKKVEEGISPEEVIDAVNSVATERNIKNVGELPLSEELKARGIESGTLYVMSFCNPETARKMVDFAPAMGAYLPCRVTLVEKEDGLWLYSLNMDMMIKMGMKMDDALLADTTAVRDTIWEMLERGAAGEF